MIKKSTAISHLQDNLGGLTSSSINAGGSVEIDVNFVFVIEVCLTGLLILDPELGTIFAKRAMPLKPTIPKNAEVSHFNHVVGQPIGKKTTREGV
jgi:hypothetical protein